MGQGDSAYSLSPVMAHSQWAMPLKNGDGAPNFGPPWCGEEGDKSGEYQWIWDHYTTWK